MQSSRDLPSSTHLHTLNHRLVTLLRIRSPRFYYFLPILYLAIQNQPAALQQDLLLLACFFSWFHFSTAWFLIFVALFEFDSTPEIRANFAYCFFTYSPISNSDQILGTPTHPTLPVPPERQQQQQQQYRHRHRRRQFLSSHFNTYRLLELFLGRIRPITI